MLPWDPRGKLNQRSLCLTILEPKDEILHTPPHPHLRTKEWEARATCHAPASAYRVLAASSRGWKLPCQAI